MNDLETLLARSRPAWVQTPLHKQKLEELLRRKIRGGEPEMLSLRAYAMILAVCMVLLMLVTTSPLGEVRAGFPKRQLPPGFPQVYSPARHGIIRLSWEEWKQPSWTRDLTRLQLQEDIWAAGHTGENQFGISWMPVNSDCHEPPFR